MTIPPVMPPRVYSAIVSADSVDLELRRRLEGHIENLPVLPMALSQLLSLDQEDDDYFEKVLTIIESEPNFAARLLIAANSAASAPSNPVTTLANAVARIGSKGATNLVLALSVTRVFIPRDQWERSLWRHGVQVAHAARALATAAGDQEVNPDEAYTCALLHDIGRFVLFQEAPDRLRMVDEGDWDTPQLLVEQEKEICGITHPELGAMACTKWKLPAPVVAVIRNHHRPLPERYTSGEDKMAAIVRLADLAMFPSTKPGSEHVDKTMEPDVLAASLQHHVPRFLSLTTAKLASIIEQSAADADAACEALGIGPD